MLITTDSLTFFHGPIFVQAYCTLIRLNTVFFLSVSSTTIHVCNASYILLHFSYIRCDIAVVCMIHQFLVLVTMAEMCTLLNKTNVEVQQIYKVSVE